MAKRGRPYGPSKKNITMMAFALELLQSVPYSPSLRWLFYQMFQKYGLPKKGYNTFKAIVVRFRKRFWHGWTPSSLTDDTRVIHNFNEGTDPETWIKQVKKYGIDCNLDKHIGQERIVQIWFEAQAMYEQFEYYTKPYYVTLVPFKGDASIPLKWKLAKALQNYRLDQRPVTVLYFGDYDPKGLQIPDSALTDIRTWAHLEDEELRTIGPEFEFIRVGLNKDHISQYNLPENPNAPGSYQWEALDDEGAKELILGTLEKYVDMGKIKEIEKLQLELEKSFNTVLEDWEPPELEEY